MNEPGTPQHSQQGTPLVIGPWLLSPDSGLLAADGVSRMLRPVTAAVLRELASQAGEVIAPHSLQARVGQGSEPVSLNVLRKAVREARAALEHPGQPRVTIDAIAKRGYRLQVHEFAGAHTAIDSRTEPASGSTDAPTRHRRGEWNSTVLPALLAALALSLPIGIQAWLKRTSPPLGVPVPASDAASERPHASPRLLLLPLETPAPDARARAFGEDVTRRIVAALGDFPSLARPDQPLSGAPLLLDMQAGRATALPAGSRAALGTNGARMRSPEGLGATHVLNGSVQRAGDRLQVSISLLKVGDDRTLHEFEQTVQPEEDPALAAQRLAAQVVSTIAILTDERHLRNIVALKTRSIDAYMAWQEAGYITFPVTTAALRRAETLFARARTFDPTFEAAIEGQIVVHEQLARIELRAEARAAALTRADALDDQLSHLPTRAALRRELAAARLLLLNAPANQREAQARSCLMRKTARDPVAACRRAYLDLLIGAGLHAQADSFVRLHGQHDDRGWGHDHRALIALLREGPRSRMPLAKERWRNNIALMAIAAALLEHTGDSESASYFAETLLQSDTEGFWAAAAAAHLRALDPARKDAAPRPAQVQGGPPLLPWFAGIAYLMKGDVAAGLRAWQGMSPAEVTMASLYQALYERTFPPGVVQDARYQAALEGMGLGRSWKAMLRRHVAELAPVTGIDPG